MALFLRVTLQMASMPVKLLTLRFLATHMLCQIQKPKQRAPWPAWRCRLGWTQWLLWTLALPALAQNMSAQDSTLAQVTQWVKKTQQLADKQFSVAPLDSRVRIQDCDRPLLMDLPFASRETVRVRCQSEAPWQMYLQLVLAVPVAAAPAAKAAEVPPANARKVVVATQLLRRGTMVNTEQLQEMEYSGVALDAQAVSSIRDLEHGELVRDIPAGTPLRSHDVRRAVLVRQGQSVLLTVALGNGLSITARVDAMQDGKMGEQVRLKNPESGRLVSGIVTGPNAVRAQQ